MTRRDRDTPDLFAIAPPPADLAGSREYRPIVAGIVSTMLKDAGVDRYEVAARMSRMVNREVSKFMLDAWSAEGREDHNLPYALGPVLEIACDSFALSAWNASVRGARIYVGRDAIDAELGLLEHSRDRLNAQIRELRERREKHR